MSATTVIADRTGIASESQLTYTSSDNYLNMEWCKKIHTVRGLYTAGAGVWKDLKKFRAWLNGTSSYPYGGNFQSVVIWNEQAWIFTGDSRRPTHAFFPIVLGTGGEHAMRAYLRGASLKGAVRYAIKKDKWSAGKIQYIKLHSSP